MTAPAGTDANSASSTETQGVAPVASPTTETTSAPKLTLAQRMQESAKALEAQLGTRTADAREPEVDEQQIDEGNEAADVQPESEGDDADKAKDDPKSKEPETVPMAAFKARVGKLTEQRRQALEQLDEATGNLATLEEYVKVLQGELARYRQAAVEGNPIDERDEQIRLMQLREDFAKRDAERDAQLAQARAQRANDEKVEALRQQVTQQLDDAVQAHPMVSREYLKSEAAKVANRGKTIAEVAAELETKLLAAARAKLGVAADPAPQKQPVRSPSTVRGRIGGAAQTRHPPTAAGMLARALELEQQLRR